MNALPHPTSWSTHFANNGRRFGLILLCLAAFVARAEAADPPVITSFGPTSGPVGSTVVINGTGFVPPISIVFSGNALAAGNFTSTQITVTVPSGAADGPITVDTSNGSAVTAGSFIVGNSIPAASVTATTPTTTVGSSTPGEFMVTLSGAAANDTLVNYQVSGNAANGTDYQFLKGTAKIKAGKTSKEIKVVGMGTLGGHGKRTVKLTLNEGTGYTVLAGGPVVMKILAGQ